MKRGIGLHDPRPSTPMDVEIPLAASADRLLHDLAQASGAAALAALEGRTLLGERAMLANFTIPRRISAGGGCRLFDARDDAIALNLSRQSDRDLLPALFATEFDATNDDQIASLIAGSDASALVDRARSMGLAIAAEHEIKPRSLEPCVEMVSGLALQARSRQRPRVIDLSALWAGPLAAHLLWLAGADVIKVESRTRPDAMREGDSAFYALLNQGKASVVLDFADANDRAALLRLLASADVVIEAARPRALEQLGIDAAQIVRSTPGLAWITITAHGAIGDAANWVGFGDDCGVAGGLSAALRDVSGHSGFVGDAIADPLTGLQAAVCAWNAWSIRRGGRFGIAMSHVVARCLTEERRDDSAALDRSLLAWSHASGQPFPRVQQRTTGTLAARGEHTRFWLEQVSRC